MRVCSHACKHADIDDERWSMSLDKHANALAGYTDRQTDRETDRVRI